MTIVNCFETILKNSSRRFNAHLVRSIHNQPQDVVRVGCGSGFWGDTPSAPKQLIKSGEIDYLMLDYLSEVTMSLLVAAKEKNPKAGWCPDLVSSVVPYLKDIKQNNVKIVTNAGGINPIGCMEALKVATSQTNATTPIKIACVLGDDLLVNKDRSSNDHQLPSTTMSLNIYTGAQEIVTALEQGADIVITGRAADSALALGPLVHSLGWNWEQFDMLAAGSLAGHIIECGAQASGGIFTDWDKVVGWENCGFPIANVKKDGKITITKPKNTGGLITRGTIAEQLLYEIHDPKSYILPDVVCDFSNVLIEECGPNIVRLEGAKGLPPTAFYKAGGTFQNGWKATTCAPIIGIDASSKGKKTADAILKRCRSLFQQQGLGDFDSVVMQMIGTEQSYGIHQNPDAKNVREVVMWLAVRHQNRKALQIFSREVASAGTGMAPGLTTLIGGRPNVSPCFEFFSSLVPKSSTELSVLMDTGEKIVCQPAAEPSGGYTQSMEHKIAVKNDTHCSSKNSAHSGKILKDIAWMRSGDKGDTCNIGVIPRDPGDFEFLRSFLTEERVGQYFAHKFKSEPCVERFELYGIPALNFVLKNCLGGGGIASSSIDPLGKGFGSMLASMPIS